MNINSTQIFIQKLSATLNASAYVPFVLAAESLLEWPHALSEAVEETGRKPENEDYNGSIKSY